MALTLRSQFDLSLSSRTAGTCDAVYIRDTSSCTQAAALEALQSSVNALLATKYLAAAGLVCSLWDHLITLDEEIGVLWAGRPWDFTRVIFITNRYGIEGCLIYVAYIFAGLRPAISETVYEGRMLGLSVVSICFTASANVFITLRHYSLWDRRRGPMIILFSAFVVIYTAVVVLAGFTVKAFHDFVEYSPLLGTCYVQKKPLVLIGVWAGMLAFDVFTICLAVVNALDRPRRHDIEVLSQLRRDGAIVFIVLMVLHLLLVVNSIISGPSEIFIVTFFAWSLISITVSRLILRVEALKPKGAVRTWQPAQNMFEMDRWVRD